MPELTLVTFNTHYGRRAKRDGCTPYDLGAVLDELADADVLAIQEVWRPDGETSAVDAFAARHGYDERGLVFGRASVARRWPGMKDDGEGTIGLSVLSRLPMRAVGEPAVGPTWRDPAPDRRVVQVEVDVDGTPLQLVAVHISSQLPYAPPMQLRRLARVLDGVPGPAVLTGDCNFWGPPASMCLPGWRRGVRGRTWPAHRPHSQIDHVFLRGGVQALSGEVLPDSGSDHRPVRVKLRVG
jgi:endonuclease/exonuclease/phosphatase family metal-dependent hydrolase